jgi:hypothetical protein
VARQGSNLGGVCGVTGIWMEARFHDFSVQSLGSLHVSLAWLPGGLSCDELSLVLWKGYEAAGRLTRTTFCKSLDHDRGLRHGHLWSFGPSRPLPRQVSVLQVHDGSLALEKEAVVALSVPCCTRSSVE